MNIQNLVSLKGLRLAVAQIVTASLIAIALPATPAKALFGRAINPYTSCAADLTRAKVSAAEAANACGQALKPDDLGTCVNRIVDEKVAGSDALSVCRQVRRPVDAASCVVGIRRGVTDTAIVDVLDSCRRSLLPQTFSDCVVGLNSQLKVGGKQAISSCLDASDRPRDLLPTFIPIGKEIPIPTHSLGGSHSDYSFDHSAFYSNPALDSAFTSDSGPKNLSACGRRATYSGFVLTRSPDRLHFTLTHVKYFSISGRRVVSASCSG